MNWKDKIGTPQFWAILAGVITSLLVMFNVGDVGIDKVTSVIMAVGTLVCFIVTGTYVEVKAKKARIAKKERKKEDRE